MNTRKRTSNLIQTAALLASLAGSLPAGAQTTNDDRWKFRVAPYLMGASLSGTAVVQGRPADVDVSASDIFDNMDYGFMAMVVGMFMAILDIQIVIASVNEIQAGLSASPDEVSWVQTSYLVA